MARRVLLLATILCAFTSRARVGQAQQGPNASARSGQAQQSPDAGTRPQQTQPLSDEDADVVKRLALLEDVELLRNLDLFDEKSAGAVQSSDAGIPDAGTAPAAQPPDAGTARASQPPDAGTAPGPQPEPRR